MTCKDCMHYEVCIRRQNSISLDPMKCGYKCPEFKNKADFAEIEQYKARIANDTEYTERIEVENRKQKAEIERLKGLENHHRELINELNKGIAKAKAEAFKEFAQSLKDYYIKDKRYKRPNASTMIIFLFDLIDKLVKEKTGGKT